MQKIGFIGCGNLGLSLLNGIRKKEPQASLYGSKRNIGSLKQFENEVTFFTSNNQEVIKECDVIILALKPYTIIPFLKENALFYLGVKQKCILLLNGPYSLHGLQL